VANASRAALPQGTDHTFAADYVLAGLALVTLGYILSPFIWLGTLLVAAGIGLLVVQQTTTGVLPPRPPSQWAGKCRHLALRAIGNNDSRGRKRALALYLASMRRV
jgi:hypothetical protein